MADELTFSIKRDHVLVETEIDSLDSIKSKLMLHYIIEIHDTENDKVGVVTQTDEDDNVTIRTYDTFSEANAHRAIMTQQEEWKKFDIRVVSKVDE